MSELSITSSQVQGTVTVTILHLKGQFDRVNSHKVLDQARQAREDGATYLLLDLSDVSILTSSGLLTIQSIFKLFTPERDKEIMHEHHEEPYKSPYLKLACPNAQIYYVLNIAGFLQNILIYNNMEEAINSFSS